MSPLTFDVLDKITAMTAFTPSTIAALVIAASFAAGLNVYATVMTLGLLAHCALGCPAVRTRSSRRLRGSSPPAGRCSPSNSSPTKSPAWTLIWNALHTFIRVPVAGLIAYRATSHLSPEMQLLATVGGALIALAAHGSKTAVRAIVTPSPEPVSNIAFSTGEDGIAIGLTWFATRHPWTAAGIAIALILLAVVMARWIVRTLRKMGRKIGTRGIASPQL